MPTTWKFFFWQEWLGDRGQLFAARIDATEASQARGQHAAAMQFLWVQGDMSKPSVSDLFADNGNGTKCIADGRVRDLP